MMPLYEDPHFTFRFADDRIISRFHLEGVEVGRHVYVFKIDPGTGEKLSLLATATVGDGGWVDLAKPIIVRAGEAFLAVPVADPIIRQETISDYEAIHHVNRLAFGQDGEANLVNALRKGDYVRLSLVAEQAGQIVGHILFSDLPIITEAGILPALALAPLAVQPEFQNQSIGSALVRCGLDECRKQGHKIVVVLGHTHFYPRFGFSPKLAENLESPFSGKDSFMALELVPGALNGVKGKVQYAPPFGCSPDRRKSVERNSVARQATLIVQDGTYAVCGLDSNSSIPAWATEGNFFSITRTADELSIVCRQNAVAEGIQCERGWHCLRVAGTIPFSVVGVVASLTAPLAEAGISVLVVSTFDTDYLFIKEADFQTAVAALRGAGHSVEGVLS
jgi:putative acetyltransferase